MSQPKGFIAMGRISRDDPLFRLFCKNSPILFLLQIYDHKTGVCPTTLQGIEHECGMTRQQVRTALSHLQKAGLLSIKTFAGAVKGERGFRKISTVSFNLNHSLLKRPKEYLGETGRTSVSDPPPSDGYPAEFNEDWGVYCGTSRDKVGDKKSAYKSWKKAVLAHGRDKVMQGTITYVAMCESRKPNPQWKKNGGTWWNAKEARYMSPEYQGVDNPSIAFWKLNKSPVLGNILKGGSKIIIIGDEYMAEALIRLKGSDPVLGTTLDRLRDKKFEEVFIRSYELAKKSAKPRTEIYTQYEQSIIWDTRSSVDNGTEQEKREGSPRKSNSGPRSNRNGNSSG